MKIKSQLLIVFTVIVFISSTVGVVAYLNLAKIVEDYDHLNQIIIPETDLLKDFRNKSDHFSSLTLSYALGGIDELLRSQIKYELKSLKAEFNSTNDAYADIIDKYFPDEIETKDEINQKWNTLVLLSNNIIQETDNLYGNSSKPTEVATPQIINSTPSLSLFSDYTLSNEPLNESKSSNSVRLFFSAHQTFLSTIGESLEQELAESEEIKSEITLTFRTTLQSIIISIIVSIFIAFIIVIFVSKKLSQPIIELQKATGEILSGNYNYPLMSLSSGASEELIELSSQFNKMRHTIHQSTNNLKNANEKLLIRENQLEKANDYLIRTERAKEEFISMVSHELRTPLGPAKGYLEMLLRPKIGGMLSDRQTKYIQIIYRNIQKLEMLVGDVLDVYKLDMGRLHFSKSETDVRSLINSIILDLKPLAIENNIELKADTRIEKGTTILCDSKRIEQVFANLIKNSIDFVPKNTGKIIVKAENSKENESLVYFVVEDNGIGISPDKVDNLFRKFYQIDTSATRKHGGTGLGLVICKGIIEAHGGRIWIDKSYTSGLRVIFTLPKKSQTNDQETDQ